MPDPNETPVPDPDEAERVRLTKEGDEAARQFRELQLEGAEHGRAGLDERAEERPIHPESGPGHYDAASRYAREAAKALRSDEVARAQALAGIGQIHATLAAAAAALHSDFTDAATLRAWKEVTGQG